MTQASARAVAVSGVDRLGAHAALWYGQARYRLAWLVLPQAAVALAAGLALALVGTGAEWGKPADSKESEKLYADLLEKAGKDGDKAAFDKLKTAAEAGEISARSFMGVLHDPDMASVYPKSPVKPDVDKALGYYQRTADLGYPGAQRGMTELLLNPAHGHYDAKRGCRYGLALHANPAVARAGYAGFWPALYRLAGCYVTPESGVPRDPQKAAATYMETVAAGVRAAATDLTDGLGRRPPDLVSAIQRNLTRRGFYSGPIDGTASPQTIAAVRALSGKVAPTGGSAPAGGAAPPGGAAGGEGKNPAPPASEPVPSVDALTALYKSAPTNAADAAKLRDFAEKGFAVAQFLYASLVSPTNKNAGQVAPDGRLASRYLERLAQEKEFGPAAVSAAFLYDIGGADLPRDPAKAADMTVRALELKAKDILPNLENDKWGAGYWAALQQRLAARKLYRGRIVDQRNDRTLQAAGDLLGNP